MNEKFLNPYDPASTEARIYKLWEESGLFNPEKCIVEGHTSDSAEPFTIILPPPNVTGTLHLGHADMVAIQDTIIRYKRMSGFRTLWLPGTDHAAIATQSKVEKILSKDGIRKNDLGREEFLKRVEDFAQESHDTIISQLKSMGASLDWSREAYTLDKIRERAVQTAFKNMYEDGLIYRGERIVNWDPKGQTTISDDEIVYEERDATLYTFKYSPDFPISISTTRPETKLGDTAVAVHPDDERYKKYIGQTFDVNFIGVDLKIKIVSDENVEPDFGTGALGVTPAHSHIDFDIAKKNSLPLIKVINEFAKISENIPAPFTGLKVLDARNLVVEKLREAGLIEKEETTKQNISTAERTGGIIEPLPKLQWWIDVNKEFAIKNSQIDGIKTGDKVTLKKLMHQVVENNQIEILPERFSKTYYNWIDNLHDWCISRQIWYGHRIPVWYKGTEIFVGAEAPSSEWIQDEDTLDTWFSSGLWTFSTLGWPDETEDMKIYHPTNVLETGYDIIFFWVARMILMSTYHLGQIPFKTVYLHGLVRDEKGVKMSKSLGNTIDPVEVANEYGADAVRMALLVGVGPGADSNLGENKIKAYKKFSNKIWNIARFIQENVGNSLYNPNYTLTNIDKITLEELTATIAEVTDDIENYRLYLASEKLYHFTWHKFADEILEESKNIFKTDIEAEIESRKQLLMRMFDNLLKTLHPFIPFITEEINQSLSYNNDKTLLMVQKWPLLSDK
ncbi:MAG: valine--tRNA ligase [Candidatus Paceibacterota bacterium]